MESDSKRKDAHREREVRARPPAPLKAAAWAVLDERNREMGQFLEACLARLVADPDGFLADLEPHYPDRRRGRRPKR